MGARIEVAGGSVRGTRHRRIERNNQDAWHWETRGGVTVAAVTDGCSSGRSSEAGALLGARLAVRRAHELAARAGLADAQAFAAALTRALRRDLIVLLDLLGDPAAADDLLLFTVGLAIIDAHAGVICWAGDGVYAVNGVVRRLESRDNRPDYPAYDAVRPPDTPPLAPLRAVWSGPAEAVETLLIGTDGLLEWEAAAPRPLSGDGPAPGALSQLLTSAAVFRNPDRVRRILALANRESRRPDWSAHTVRVESGLLPDDTTVVVLRRVLEPCA